MKSLNGYLKEKIRMELISVIIPTYNRCEKLKMAMESVLTQTYENIELLVIDDGSTDNTHEMIEGIADERVKYIRLPHNMGAAAARNEGVRLAQGEFVAFHDSDDLWLPEKLEKQMNYWNNHPECSMIYCAYLFYVDNNEYRTPDMDRGNLEGDILRYLLLRNSIGTPTMLMRKHCFEEVGGFNTSLHCLEDWEFAIRFAESFYIGYVDEVLVNAFYSAGGISSKLAEFYEAKCYIISKYQKYYVQYDVFTRAVSELFQHAAGVGVVDEVREMLATFLSTTERA